MIRIPGRIPITIHSSFWLVAALIGFLYSRTVGGTVVWIGIILVSVLFHECGHALTALLCGQHPQIELVALGGLTLHQGHKLPYWKQFFIVFNGPLFGFLLAVFAFSVLRILPATDGVLGAILQDVFVINLFWTVLNLIPVLPLDGGQLLRILMEAIFGAKGFRYTLVVGIIVALTLSLACFIVQQFFLGVLLFLFFFQSVDAWKRSAHFADSDCRQELHQMYETAEELLVNGRTQEATALFETLRQRAKKGILWSKATQRLGVLEYEAGHHARAYTLLREVQSDVTEEALTMLHALAFGEKNYPLVAAIAARAFQHVEEPQVAFRSALAFAQLGQAKLAMGWLRAAYDTGAFSVTDILSDPLLDPIRNHRLFKEYATHLTQA